MLVDRLSKTPTKPGVYTFKDHKDKILYVGKAKNLKNRLKSYFHSTHTLDPRKASMMKLVSDFSYVITENELEALILEANLIKQYKPRFNIVLRDDKNYPYLKLTVGEEWPRLEVARKITQDRSIYFGPYVPAQTMWDTLAFIRRNFPIRTCSHSLDKPERPCIQYQMGRCPAPCGRRITRDHYMKIVEEVRLFLNGNNKKLLWNLENEMKKFSGEMKFEEAAGIRDRINNIRHTWQSQKVVIPELGDIDAIGFFSDGIDGIFEVFFVRNGILIGNKDFFVKFVGNLPKAELLNNFLKLFYAKEIIPPGEIIVGSGPDDITNIKGWLRMRRGTVVKIRVPKGGKKLELLRMADANAEQIFKSKKYGSRQILQVLKERLGLSFVPRSIGAFDVSTIGGNESVGAFIYWSDGEFRKEFYRHVRIKNVSGVDDYAMMNEVVGRIVNNLSDKIPDLLVIDGGKGQLEIARNVIERENILCEGGRKPMIIAVAKDPDRAITSCSEVVSLGDGSPSSLLLRKVRDEVHRFAVTYHRRLRGKRLIQSPLEKIPGIGKKRRFELLKFFGSIDAMRKATVDDIAKIKGFNRKVAENLANELRR